MLAKVGPFYIGGSAQEIEQAYEQAFVTGPELETISRAELEQRCLTQYRLAQHAEKRGVDLNPLYARLDPECAWLTETE